MTKTVRVRYFALLREQRGLSEETVATGASSVRELYEELRAAHGLSFPAERMRVAVNDEFGGWDSVVSDGDLLVFIPPVAGG